VEENVGALDIQITPEGRERIEEIAPKGVAAGQRYPEPARALVNQ